MSAREFDAFQLPAPIVNLDDLFAVILFHVASNGWRLRHHFRQTG
jgi:hypothetical protein